MCLIVERREVLFLLIREVFLRKAVVIIVGNLFVMLAGLYFASIAFLPKGKIEIMAIIANPVAFPRLRERFGLSLLSVVDVLQWSQVLVHPIFLLFGF